MVASLGLMIHNLIMKKLLYIFPIILLLLIINGLLHSIYDLWSKQDILTQAQKTLETEKEKNDELKRQLQVAQSPEFVESQARNKLFLTKPDEKEVIIPVGSQSAVIEKKPELQNWQKWLNLFW